MIYEYKNNIYPSYLKEGNAQSYIQKVALHFCKGVGLDIGGHGDWVLPQAFPINIEKESKFDAYNLPPEDNDFIFSSHCLEHLDNYLEALNIWWSHLRKDGVLFLYLPHADMEYWKPENNKKHKWQFYPKEMRETLKEIGFKDIMISERDMYWSFTAVGFKK